MSSGVTLLPGPASQMARGAPFDTDNGPRARPDHPKEVTQMHRRVVLSMLGVMLVAVLAVAGAQSRSSAGRDQHRVVR